nr:MAG TPA: hypothetical protein [Caudoviricetes sp.]
MSKLPSAGSRYGSGLHPAGMAHLSGMYLSLACIGKRQDAVSFDGRTAFSLCLLVTRFHQSGANTIGVVVPVVVVGAIGVDVPDVVVIVGVRRAQPPNGSVRQTNRTLYAKRLPAVRLRFRVKDSFQGGSLFGQPFPFRFCPEFFGTSAFRREPLHRRVFYVRDLLCPDTGFLRADDTFLRADGQVFQQQRAAVHDCANLLNALVVVGLEIDVIRRVCIQQDLPGGQPDALAIQPERALGKALPVPCVECMDGSAAHLLDVAHIFERRDFLDDLPGIAPADVVGDNAGRPLGVTQQLPCIRADFERFSHRQNSTLACSAFHTPVTVRPSRLPNVALNGFLVTFVPNFSSMALMLAFMAATLARMSPWALAASLWASTAALMRWSVSAFL